MKQDDAEYVKSTISEEGFHYTFDGYSNFSGIEDEKFHKLRAKYLNSAKEMKDYLDEQINKQDE